MKLLKKLLPIASVAGVAAIVTPLVTSCGGQTFKITDGKAYESKFEDSDLPTTKFKSTDDLTEAYLDMVKKDTSIFGDDFMCGNYFVEMGEGYNATIKIALSSVDPEEHTLNAKFDMSIKAKDVAIAKQKYADGESHIKFSIKKFKIEVNNVAQGEFFVSPDDEWLDIEENDDIDASLTQTLKGKADGKTIIDTTMHLTGAMAALAFNELDSCHAYFISHYLSHCDIE